MLEVSPLILFKSYKKVFMIWIKSSTQINENARDNIQHGSENLTYLQPASSWNFHHLSSGRNNKYLPPM